MRAQLARCSSGHAAIELVPEWGLLFCFGFSARPSGPQPSLLTVNPHASSKAVGTYLLSLWRRTHSLSSAEVAYCVGDRLSWATMSSKQLGIIVAATICSGDVKCGFPRGAMARFYLR